jgi:hypothetical protein
MSGRPVDAGLVAWCCAHYPTSCPAHGFADTEPAATVETVAHYVQVHK